LGFLNPVKTPVYGYRKTGLKTPFLPGKVFRGLRGKKTPGKKKPPEPGGTRGNLSSVRFRGDPPVPVSDRNGEPVKGGF